jgi:O-antigen/teichoic acid export membrane protein
MTTRKNSLLSDGAWLTGLQGLAAVGQLAGVRMLTGILPPAVFGEFSLWLGVVTLAATGLANPIMQAMLRYYPEYALHGNGELVKTVARRQLFKIIAWTIPAFLAGAIAVLTLGWATLTALGLLMALITVEIVRMQGTTLLNATRAHRSYGIWAVAEAWGRPLLAWSLVTLMGATATVVLAGFLLASLCAWVAMRQFIPRDEPRVVPIAEQSALVGRFWQYTLPLLPLGLLGWVSGMADRYMIGALLSPADVGLYVAIYGLASRPMLVFSGIVETTIRPAYQSALVEGDNRRAHDYLRKWVVVIALGSLMALALACVGHSWLARLLLGEPYRSVSGLLPWIVGGYALLALSDISTRVCYAHGASDRVLLIVLAGSLSALLFGYYNIRAFGLLGAAIAVPLYFGVQLVISFSFGRRYLRFQNSIV